MDKKIVAAFIALLFCGCARIPLKKDTATAQYTGKQFIEINEFCSRHHVQYTFDTLDDIVQLRSDTVDMKVLLASHLAYVNGNLVSLRASPFYRKGVVYFPSELSTYLLPRALERLRRSAPVTSITTIVIDPGHGGKDPGAISKGGLKEKHVNLKIARLLKRRLQNQGYTVRLTRNDDRYLTLKQRVRYARDICADLFISVHANANRSRNVKGFEVYYLSEKILSGEAKALMMSENASLEFDEQRSGKNTKRIVWDLICAQNNTLSLEFANSVIRTFKKMGFYTRSPRGAPFYVLKYAYVPSVLVEVGYLTNPQEEKLLRQEHYLQQIARGIALSVDVLNKRHRKFVSAPAQ